MSNQNTVTARWRDNPSEFRNLLMIDTTSGPEPFNERVEAWQEADFQALDSGWQRAVIGTSHKATFSRAWLERPRGHSKSSDIAIMAAWALCASDRQISGYAGAGDRDQAGILRNAIGRLLFINPWLSKILEVQNYRVMNKRTGSHLEIISSDAPTSYGLNPDFLICDEVVHWPKRDLFDSLLSSSAKRSTCMLVCISNAGLQDDWAWELREKVRVDPDWHFSRLEGPVATWITPEQLAENERLLPNIAYQRLWLNRWTTGGGDALSPDVINAAFAGNHRRHQSSQDGFEYVGGLDLGVTRDASALVILGVKRSYEGHGRIRLAHTQIWRPAKDKKIKLQEIEDTLIKMHQRFKLKCLNFDPWQATHMAQRLTAAGLGVPSTERIQASGYVPMTEVTQGGSNLQAMATTLIEAFNDYRIELYDDPDLRRDLFKFRIEEKSYGYRLVSPRDENGHGDMGSAFAMAMLAASELAGKRQFHAGAVNLDSGKSMNGRTLLERAYEAFDNGNGDRLNECMAVAEAFARRNG